ncbi:MAG: VOC family protein, partial [Planctomycetota bacterium]
MPRLAIALTTLVVPDYDSALKYFVNVLGFDLREDTRLDAEKSWVVVAPTASGCGGLLLAKAAN